MNIFSVFNGSKVVITGHTGFKGAWLSLWLTHLGAKVTGVSFDVPSAPSHFIAANLANCVDDVRLDIRSGSDLKSLIQNIQPNFVFHLAAQALVRKSYSDPIDTWQTNAIGTINLLESLRSVESKCVAIFITSDKCYDNVEWVWGYRETDALGGPDPYSASKGSAELAIRSYVRSYFHSDGLVRIGVGRAGNVIGGGDWANDRIVPDCMRAWSSGNIVSLRNPASTRPWQHVLEPLSGYLNLSCVLNESPELNGEAFNFGPLAQNNYSVGKLVSSMTEYWDKVRWEDVSAQYGGPYESGLLKLNCDKALHYLQWKATWDFEETVSKTVLWYRHFYEQPDKSIYKFSLSQIIDYSNFAKGKGLRWAQ